MSSPASGSKRPRDDDGGEAEGGEKRAVLCCRYCDKLFTSTSDRIAHEKGAHDGDEYLCSYEGCGKVCTKTSGRRTHEKSAHEGVKYSCSYEGCDKVFTVTSNRTRHEKSAHEGV